MACCHTNQIAWGENYTYKSSQIPSLQILWGQSLLLATHYYDHWVGHDTEVSWGQLASALAGKDGAVAIKIWNQCITGCKSKFATDTLVCDLSLCMYLMTSVEVFVAIPGRI